MKFGMRIVIPILVALAWCFLLAPCGIVNEGPSGECSAKESGLIEVDGEADTEDCGKLVKYLRIEQVLTTSDMEFYEILGEIFIDFDTAYYLRGKGVSDENCYGLLYGESPFTARARYPECTERADLDIIREPDAQAKTVCTIHIYPEVDCESRDLE